MYLCGDFYGLVASASAEDARILVFLAYGLYRPHSEECGALGLNHFSHLEAASSLGSLC